MGKLENRGTSFGTPANKGNCNSYVAEAVQHATVLIRRGATLSKSKSYLFINGEGYGLEIGHKLEQHGLIDLSKIRNATHLKQLIKK